MSRWGRDSRQTAPSSVRYTSQQSAQEESSIHSPQEQEQQEATQDDSSTCNDESNNKPHDVLSSASQALSFSKPDAPTNCQRMQTEEEKQEVEAAEDVGHDAALEEDTGFPLGLNILENDGDDRYNMKSVLELALVAEM